MGRAFLFCARVLSALSSPVWAEKQLYSQVIRTDVLSGRAEPTEVIADLGGIPIDELLYPDGIEPNDEPEAAPALNDGWLSPGLYPVQTDLMSVGVISEAEGRDIPSYLVSQPIFIVGYDRASANWLINNVDILEQNQAVGLVVNVDTPEQMRELLRITEHRLMLQPVNGNRLAQSLKLYHYPAYIDQDGVLR
jgi:integrating conjugative element protein (TIGR03765 family)